MEDYMGIKSVIYIKLPFAIQLKDSKDYLFEFHISKFDEFHITFLHNSDDDEDRYNNCFDDNFCIYLKVISIYNAINYEDYPHSEVFYTNRNTDEFTVELPAIDTMLVFSEHRIEQNNELYKRNDRNVLGREHSNYSNKFFI